VPDLAAAAQAAAAFLRALGVPVSLRDTPRRMAQAYAELFTPEPFEVTTFPNDEGYDELVLARDIPLRSVCEHHLLPFVGTACVGYLPGEQIVGLSKLARVRLSRLRVKGKWRLTPTRCDSAAEISEL
jgi:GTP cyclohydrolase I